MLWSVALAIEKIHHRFWFAFTGVLCSAQKEQSNIIFTCLSSCWNGYGNVHLLQIPMRLVLARKRRRRRRIAQMKLTLYNNDSKFCANHSSIYIYRKSRNPARCYKCICSRGHVRLLLYDIVSAWVEKFHVVEKAYHTNPTGKHRFRAAGIFEMQMFHFMKKKKKSWTTTKNKKQCRMVTV